LAADENILWHVLVAIALLYAAWLWFNDISDVVNALH
jgi:hypothetical protein